jgi:hypothetical protein
VHADEKPVHIYLDGIELNDIDSWEYDLRSKKIIIRSSGDYQTGKYLILF